MKERRRSKRSRPEPPPAPPVSLRRTINQEIKLPCVMCNGTGICLGILEEPLVLTCGCTYGMRLLCGTPEGSWPMSFGRATRHSERLGLRAEAEQRRADFSLELCRQQAETVGKEWK